jgi:hypothetical protein
MTAVTRLPLITLVTPQGEATPAGDLSVEDIRALLRQNTVRFVVADVGRPLQWVPEMECFGAWKDGIQQHVADPTQSFRLEDFPGEFAYTASMWHDGGTPIVVLSKHH